VDRKLYVPRSWTIDPDRCRAAGLGNQTVFATKSELAVRMIGRFLDAGHRVSWVAGDEVGGNPKLRAALEARGSATCSPSPVPMKSPAGLAEAVGRSRAKADCISGRSDGSRFDTLILFPLRPALARRR